MIRQIVTDESFLSIPSTPATADDMETAKDLLDTLKANHGRCVGMAANMIGVSKRIIAISFGFMDIAMINPKILIKNGKYSTEEGCLSLKGTRQTTRYSEIRVEYQDMQMQVHTQDLKGFPAQIVQHEMDHLEGILI